MGINHFVFNGQSSLEYGVYVGGQGTYNAPQRDVTKITVPGRNGDLIKDNGRWLNIQVPYNIVVMDEFLDRTNDIRAWLCETTDYARLEDTYHPDYFRMARFSNSLEFETSAFNRTGKATVIFDCKPQRWLKTGEQAVSMANGGNIFNPTRFSSRPLIRIIGSGNGTVTVGNYTIAVTDMSTYIDVDSEIQDCYIGSTSANNKVTLSAGFPLLVPGNTTVSWTGGVTDVDITGRWYTI